MHNFKEGDNDGTFNSRTHVNPIHLRKEDSQLLFNFMYE